MIFNLPYKEVTLSNLILNFVLLQELEFQVIFTYFPKLKSK